MPYERIDPRVAAAMRSKHGSSLFSTADAPAPTSENRLAFASTYASTDPWKLDVVARDVGKGAPGEPAAA